MVQVCWLLLLLTSIQNANSLPKPREDLALRSRESINTRELRPDKSNRILLQPPIYIYPERYLGNDDKGTSTVQNYDNQYTLGINKYNINNDDIYRDLNIDEAIQEVFYPEHPTIGDSGDISFPEYKLPSPKETEPKKQKEHIPHSFQRDLKNGILQSKYNHNLNRKPWQNEIKNPSNNEILQNILNLEDFDLEKITLKQAFLKKAETYNITETDDKNNFLLEKKVNVSTNLKYLNSNNQLANFSDFHSSVLQEIMQKENSKKNSYNHHQSNYSFRNNHKDVADEYGESGNFKSHERLHFNDFVGGQFIDEELLGGQYPRIQGPVKNDVKNNLDEEPSVHDFVAGQFLGYNNKFLSKQRTPQNSDRHEINVQPSDFVGGQFVGGSVVSKNELLGETLNGEDNAATTMDMSSVTNDGIRPTNNNGYTERYEYQVGKELSLLSILGVQRNEDNVDKASTDLGKQGMLADKFNKKKPQQLDDTPIFMGDRPKFNKGISQKSSFVEGMINEPDDYNDQTTIITTVEAGNKELNTPQDLETPGSGTTIDLFNSNSFNHEIPTTARNSINSESSVYEDYQEDNNLGIIIDDGNNAREQSDEIQGQPSQISSNFMGTTKEVVDVVPLTGVSSEKDYYTTFQDTSTQIVKDVYLYAGKDYESNPPDKRPELNEMTSSTNIDNIKIEEETKENYLTEICFPLRNKKDVSLLDILSGSFYLENNGKKIALSLVKNPMKNCTSGTPTCKLYLEVKNISQVLEGAHETEENNLIPRNKRQSKSNILSSIEPQFEQNKSELVHNKTAFKYTNGNLNLMPLNVINALRPSQQKGDAIERLISISHNDSKKEPHKEYTQPTLFPTHEETTHKTRTKRSTADSDSCSCSILFKSTQIPSYKYFVNKRLGLLTDIVVAAKHFKDS